MTQTTATVVSGQVVVEAPIDRAFTVFTERFGDFKPPEHNVLQAPIAETVFEPRVGGHIYDRGIDGSVCRWARMLAYEPPDRVVFSWDISPQWQLERRWIQAYCKNTHGRVQRRTRCAVASPAAPTTSPPTPDVVGMSTGFWPASRPRRVAAAPSPADSLRACSVVERRDGVADICARA